MFLICFFLRVFSNFELYGKGLNEDQNELFHLFPQSFLCNLYLKTLHNSHISVVVCSFFELGTVSIWCMREIDLIFTTQSQLLTTLTKKPFRNIVGKGENAGNQHFLLFHNVFYRFHKEFLFLSYIYFVVCKCF